MYEPPSVIARTLTVSEANRVIHDIVSEFFCALSIEGEISGYRPSQSKHWYFTLKDSAAAIDCAVFRSMQYGMDEPRNGDLVIAKGTLSYYEKTGKLSFVISSMRKKGDGELQALIEKRKDYYRSLGWFDEENKKPIPDEISVLGVVTSRTGAAIRDILNIVRRRAPGLKVLLFPATVQGDGAAEEIAMRIRQANAFSACDVLIVGRGGGSAEDLACFSEPAVIEAIHESEIPVISAVGHEIDHPISDSVADRRAPTPSAAAEIVTETIFTRSTRLKSTLYALNTEIDRIISDRRRRLDAAIHASENFEKRLLRAANSIPKIDEYGRMLLLRIANAASRLGYAEDRIASFFSAKAENAEKRIRESLSISSSSLAMNIGKRSERIAKAVSAVSAGYKAKEDNASYRLSAAMREIEALSPLAILKRGYSITEKEDGTIIRKAGDISPGDKLKTRLNDGEIISVAEDINELRKRS